MGDLKPEKKLVWLGFKNPQQDQSQVQSEVQTLKDNVGDWATFQGDLDSYDLDGDGTAENISNYSQFKTYLTQNGFSSSEADAFVQKIKNSFTDDNNSGTTYDEFEAYVETEASSYQEFKTVFSSGTGLTSEQKTKDGGAAAGIEIHDSQAVSKDGVNLPPGTVEVYGNRIEFSQTDSVVTDEAIMSYSGMTISDQTPEKYQQITIEATVKNIGAVGGDAFPQLKIDGAVKKSKGPIYLLNGQSTTVSFTWTFDELVSVPVSIASLEPKTVSVVPEGLETL